MATKAAKKEVVTTTEKEVKEVKKTAVKKVAVKKETPKKVAEKKLKNPKTQELKIEEVKDTKVEETKVEEASATADKPKEEKKAVLKGSTTVEELFEAGAHFGHVVKKWNPKMRKFLWGAKNGIHIFDLEKTLSGLEEAAKALTNAAATGKRIVLVATKRQAKLMVEEEAKRLAIPYITQRWMGGLITNWKQVKQTVDRLNSLKQKKEAGQLKKYTKKEQGDFDKEIARLERIVGGISTLKDAPEVVVVFDTHKEKLVVKEASSRGVTVIGLVDSNANPDPVDFVIPMNDDSAKGLEIVIRVLGNALQNGLKEVKKN